MSEAGSTSSRPARGFTQVAGRLLAAVAALAYVAALRRAGLDPIAGVARAMELIGPTFPALLLVGWLLASDALARTSAACSGRAQPAAPHWLALCVEASPMLGLLGTVIAVGTGLSRLGVGSPEALVSSFGQALWSTALGLSLALLGEWLKHTAARTGQTPTTVDP